MISRTEDMNQELTYWAPTGVIAFGTETFETPVLHVCRWQDRAVNFVDAQGIQRVSRAVVYVGAPLSPGGWIAKGSHLGVALPRELPDAQRVAQYGGSPDLDADEILHKVWI